jgi:tetratricopeptide (TPR) repeat protein
MKRYIIFIILFSLVPFYSVNGQKGATFAWRGYKNYLAKDYQTAAEYFTKAISKNADNDTAYYYLGVCQYHLKNRNGALKSMNMAIRKNPNMIRAYYFRGQVMGRLNNSLEAINDFRKVVLLDPDNINGYYSLGVEYTNIKKYKEARQAFDKVINMNPGNKYAYAYRYRGFNHYMLGNPEQAISDLNTYISMGYDDEHWVYKTRGNAKIETKDYQGAITDFSEAIKISGMNYELAFRGRAKAYMKSGQYQKAIDDFTRVIELNPDDPYAYDNMGSIMSLLGDVKKRGGNTGFGAEYPTPEDYYTEAIFYFDKAIQHDPDYYLAFYHKGEVYEKTGRYNKAITEYERANIIEPDFKGERLSEEAAELEIIEKKFTDTTEDDILVSGEQGVLMLRLQNSEKGIANNIKILIESEPAHTDIEFKSVQYWGDIDRGKEKTIEIPFQTRDVTREGNVKIYCKIYDGTGHELAKTHYTIALSE